MNGLLIFWWLLYENRSVISLYFMFMRKEKFNKTSCKKFLLPESGDNVFLWGIGKVKVHFTISTFHEVIENGVEVQLYQFMTLALEGGRRSTPRPGLFFSGEESQDPSYKRVGGLRDQSRRAWKPSFPPVFKPQTVQSVAKVVFYNLVQMY